MQLNFMFGNSANKRKTTSINYVVRHSANIFLTSVFIYDY